MQTAAGLEGVSEFHGLRRYLVARGLRGGIGGGIDPDAIHSWHAGIHPACAYEREAARDPNHWSNTVFTNPRFLHVHTCGAYPPGEICWMVLDHTVKVDGVALWETGRLRTDTFDSIATCVDKWPVLNALFANPSDRIGIAA